MNTKVLLGCAVMLASSLALHAWLTPRPLKAPLGLARVHAPLPRPAAASQKAFSAALPSPVAETESTREQPHPITPARAAFAAQSSLFLEIERALEARDVARVRQLLKQHEQEFADLDEGADARQGYEAIAHCIESPGADSRANGERFVADHRASPLRRKVRHACLGARKPAMLPPA
jgi:hypothetical protein